MEKKNDSYYLNEVKKRIEENKNKANANQDWSPKQPVTIYRDDPRTHKVIITGQLDKAYKPMLSKDVNLHLTKASIKCTVPDLNDKPFDASGILLGYETQEFFVGNPDTEFIYTDKNNNVQKVPDKIKNQHLLPNQYVTLVLDARVDRTDDVYLVDFMTHKTRVVGFHQYPETEERLKDRLDSIHYLSRIDKSGNVINRNGAKELAIDICNAACVDKNISMIKKTLEISKLTDKLAYLPQDKVEKNIEMYNLNKSFDDYDNGYINRDKIMQFFDITEEELENYREKHPDFIEDFSYDYNNKEDEHEIGFDY